jgi:hypothetical protein
MYRTTAPEPGETPAADLTVPEATIRTPTLDRQLRRSAADITDVARCPVCRTPLIARMDCRGPYFHCLCVSRRTP